MADRSLALVTGFWPQKREVVRTSIVYVRLFEELVAHIGDSLPIVCCADPRLEPAIREALERHPEARVTVHPIPLEDLRYVRERERFRDLEPATSSNPLRDTIEYAMIVWSKIDVVRQVAAAAAELATAHPDSDPPSHLGWIDFGLPHVVELMDVDWGEVEAESIRTDAIRVCERYATTARETEDPWHFYSSNSARICGGFMTAPSSRWDVLAQLFEAEIARMVPTGSFALEEQVLAALAANHPDLFERWYADYFGMMRNVRHIRRDVDVVLQNLRRCREEGLYSEGSRITRLFLDSGASHLRLEPEQCFHLLDDGLACAVRADPELAGIMGNTTLGLLHHSRVGRGMIRGLWRRSLQESLRALNLDFPDKPWSWSEFTSRPEFRTWMSCF